MKPLVLDFALVFLQVKNKKKYFHASKIHQKGRETLEGLLHEYTTLIAFEARFEVKKCKIFWKHTNNVNRF